ncbi:hypothetical protein ACJJTC_016591 [Scirpophaga incertulas]
MSSHSEDQPQKTNNNTVNAREGSQTEKEDREPPCSDQKKMELHNPNIPPPSIENQSSRDGPTTEVEVIQKREVPSAEGEPERGGDQQCNLDPPPPLDKEEQILAQNQPPTTLPPTTHDENPDMSDEPSGSKQKTRPQRTHRKSSGMHIGTPDVARKILQSGLAKMKAAGGLRRAASIRHAQEIARKIRSDETRDLCEEVDLDHLKTISTDDTNTEMASKTSPTKTTIGMDPPPPFKTKKPREETEAPRPARNEGYSIVISNTPVKETKSDEEASVPNVQPSQHWTESPKEATSEDDWSTDAEGETSGRVSLLPPIGARTGVSKDLATERAREFYHRGKAALEESKTLKRELRAIAVEQLSSLYELVLSLADSRHRHRLNLEVERTRAAREIIRVERAHAARLKEERRLFEERLHENRQALAVTQSAVEGVQSWLSDEMDGLTKTVKAIHLVVREETIRVTNQAQTTRTDEETSEQKTKDIRAALADIKHTLGNLATEVHYLKMDAAETPKRATPSPPSSPPQPSPNKTTSELETLNKKITEMREELRQAKEQITAVAQEEKAEINKTVEGGIEKVHRGTKDILREMEEVKDATYANSNLSATGAVGLGTELVAAETSSKLEKLITPLREEPVRPEPVRPEPVLLLPRIEPVMPRVEPVLPRAEPALLQTSDTSNHSAIVKCVYPSE